MKRRYLILIAFGAVIALLCVGYGHILTAIANHVVFRSDSVRPAKHSVTVKTFGLTTRDNVRLVTEVFQPQDMVKAPAILIRIPITDTTYNRLRVGMIARYWASRGYVVAVQGTRGRYKSGGDFYPLKYERQDGIETLAWIKQQSWYDGHVVMWGGSAFGYTQWAVSDQPDIDAYFIQIASSDFHRMLHPGGAFALESGLTWAIMSRGDKDREVNLTDLDRGIGQLPISKADDAAIGDTDFYNDWVANPTRNAYWQAIDGDRRAETLSAPALLLGGWYDPFLPGQLDDYTAITQRARPDVARATRLIIGPWGHARDHKLPGQVKSVPYRSETIVQAIPWFDARLRQGADNAPKVRLYVMGINQWRSENEWPLARTRYTPFYLSENGLSATLPARENKNSYHYDPAVPVVTEGGAMLGARFGMKPQPDTTRQDVLTYTTPPLNVDTEATGPIRLILHVASDAPSADFTARLIDVHADGTAYNISDGILRRAYVDAGPQRIEIALAPTSNVFLKGHRIRLQVASSNFPLYDRNPNPGNQHVLSGPAHPSQLILPLIPANSR
jgi:uncharacterized protein